ncbi:MAG: M14 family zinc carboxypeptidase, partial [Bacteroidota bacterium]
MKQLLILLLLLPFLGIAQSDRWTTAQLGEQATKLVPKAEYPTYPEYLKLMNKLAAKYPDRCQLERWGTLPSGREILTLRLTEDITNATGRPQVLYTATMHGDET